MTGETAARRGDRERFLAWKIGGGIGVATYLILTLAFMLLGRPNADEGWYLLASRLVFSGQMPYRDFAYTQTPLLPYIYGLPQLFLQPGVLLGRVTSVAFSVSAFVIWLSIVRKRSGILGASVTALLLATFTFGLYHNSIVKTYALVTLSFTLTFFFMTRDREREWSALAAAAAALMAVLVRLSALPFTVIIVAYLLLTRRPPRVKFAVGLLAILTLAGFFLLYSQDSQAASWNLLGYHAVEQDGTPLVLQLDTFLIPCGSSTLQSFLPYILLGLVCLLFSKRTSMKLDRFSQQALVFVLAVILFGAANFSAGNCHIEYLVPAVSVMLPLLGMSFAHAYRRQKGSISRNAVLRIMLFALLISEALRGGWQFIDLSGGQLPFLELREVAEQVREQTTPTDRIIALESLWVAVEAERNVLPGLTMAQFSLFEGESDEARRLKLVNGDIMLGYLSSGAAKVVVFTDLDWANWRRLGMADQVGEALDECYEPPLVRNNYGQYAARVYLYARAVHCPG